MIKLNRITKFIKFTGLARNISSCIKSIGMYLPGANCHSGISDMSDRQDVINYIKSTGKLPGKKLSNKEYIVSEKIPIDTELDFTGIDTRHHIPLLNCYSPKVDLIDAEVISSNIAMAKFGSGNIDTLICGNVPQARVIPNDSFVLSERLKLHNTTPFDVSSGCIMLMRMLMLADNLIKSGSSVTVMCVCGTSMSHTFNRNSQMGLSMGDGSISIIVSRCNDTSEFSHVSDFETCTLLKYINVIGLVKSPLTDGHQASEFINRECSVGMNGDIIRESGILAKKLLDKHGLTSDDIDLLVGHQPCSWIGLEIAKSIGIPESDFGIRFHQSFRSVGNMGPVTVGYNLYDALRRGIYRKPKKHGNSIKVMMTSSGAGAAISCGIYDIDPSGFLDIPSDPHTENYSFKSKTWLG